LGLDYKTLIGGAGRHSYRALPRLEILAGQIGFDNLQPGAGINQRVITLAIRNAGIALVRLDAYACQS
jgi:hypothetical protein